MLEIFERESDILSIFDLSLSNDVLKFFLSPKKLNQVSMF
jgi:hypothetical protein